MSKLTKQEKKDRKQYLKTCKKYKKELMEIVKKHYGPWDNFLSNFFDVIVRHWKDYYELGYNVIALESENRPTRLQIALQMKTLYDKYQDMSVSNFKRADGSIDTDAYEEAYEKAKREFFEYYMEYADDMWD